jgi:hypothetical protein
MRIGESCRYKNDEYLTDFQLIAFHLLLLDISVI